MRAPQGASLVPPSEFGPFDELSDVAHGYYVEGFSERAVDACRRWRRLTDAAADVLTSRYFLYIEAIALQELGRHRESVSVALDLLSSLGDDADPVWRAKSLAVVAESSARLGDHPCAMSALAEADWLMESIRPHTYGHLSASMAVALALRSSNLFEPADVLLRAIRWTDDPQLDLLVQQELALLSVYWAATLQLMGDRSGSINHFAQGAGRALAMQRAALLADNPQMLARAEVIEAYAWLHVGDADLALRRALAAQDRFVARGELIETHLLHLVLGRAAADGNRFDEARSHLLTALADATTAGRDTWSAAAWEALADLDVAEHGRHPAVGIWKGLARFALARVWAEREGRFAALQDRHQVRQLTAEANRMGQVVLQDPLTGLGNRRLLAAAVQSSKAPLAAVFVDVDDFKFLNDNFSHALGDQVLRALAEILRSQCRSGEVLVRYGGDEFVILMSGGTTAAEKVARRVHESVRGFPWATLAAGLAVTVSIGVGATTQDKTNPLAAADSALLAAKRAGRDQVATIRQDG